MQPVRFVTPSILTLSLRTMLGYSRIHDIKEADANYKVLGISVWAVAEAGDKFELIGRIDRVERNLSQGDIEETFLLAGVAFIPEKNVRFIPNVWVSNFSTLDPIVLPRLTIHADF